MELRVRSPRLAGACIAAALCLQPTAAPAAQPVSLELVVAIDGSLNANRAADYVARWASTLGVTEVYVLNTQPLGSYRARAASIIRPR